MQCLPAEVRYCFFCIRDQLAGLGLEARAVNVVPNERMPGVAEMNPDLMGSPGFELTGEKCRHRLAVTAREAFQEFPVSDGFAAALAHGHFFAGVRVAVDRLIDGAPRAVGGAPDERHIAAAQRARAAVVGELRRQRLVGAVVLGHDHQARGVLVDAVDDTRPFHAADPGQAIAAMSDQRIDQGSAFVPGRGMHDQPALLVQNEDVIVLVDDIEWNILAFRFGRDRGRDVDCDRVAGFDVISGIARHGVRNGDMSCQDQRLQARA